MIKAVLFDLDNTLIDFMGMKKACCRAAIKAMIRGGLKMDEKKALDILFKLYDEHGIEYNRIFQEFLKKTAGKVDYKMLAEGIVAYRQTQRKHMKTYPEVKPTLKRLKKMGLKLGIVSDAPSLNGWIRLIELGIQNLFDVVVTFDETGKTKPSKHPFLVALKQLKVKPSETIHVGDNPERDIKGAKLLGIKTIYAKYGNFRNEKADADFTINSFGEILPIIKSLNNLP
jgi:putative hydrolase of the HAD superfamily